MGSTYKHNLVILESLSLISGNALMIFVPTRQAVSSTLLLSMGHLRTLMPRDWFFAYNTFHSDSKKVNSGEERSWKNIASLRQCMKYKSILEFSSPLASRMSLSQNEGPGPRQMNYFLCQKD